MLASGAPYGSVQSISSAKHVANCLGVTLLLISLSPTSFNQGRLCRAGQGLKLASESCNLRIPYKRNQIVDHEKQESGAGLTWLIKLKVERATDLRLFLVWGQSKGAKQEN